MSEHIRKQFMLTQENVAKLHRLAAKHRLSQSELVRNAINAYDPYQANNENEAALSMLACMKNSLRTAIDAVDNTNTTVHKTLSDLADPKLHMMFVEDAIKEFQDNPVEFDKLV